MLLYPDDAGEPAAFEFWEFPTADAITSGSSMVAADPTTALAAISAVAIREPDFGYRVSTDLDDACLSDLDDSSLLIGGNQVIPYAFGQATEFMIHGFDDQDCTGESVGGPFPFDGLPGERFHVMLHGTPGAIEALVLPMVDGLPDTSDAPAGAALVESVDTCGVDPAVFGG